MSRQLSKTRVFVANLPGRSNRHNLSTHFSKFGEVVFSTVVIDRETGVSRGYGFVEFGDPDIASSVVSQEHVLEGNVLKVSAAFERTFNNSDGSFNNSNRSFNRTKREINEPHELD
eukprot:TRINITY_DN141_c0_g1_i2.p1 TRINITY_DN141_c0_g1~~TRINITY_DN141_c0_g1_i2.p1  ORF type:complete len:116 (-),score=36.69 TRINITY_DN141_c0_g1_i2:117-464(-)